MRAADLPEIRKLKLFSSMSDCSFDTLMQAAYFQAFPAQVQLFSEGDNADFLFVLVDGCVELFAKSNGREATMAMVKPGGTFVLAAALKDAVYLMSAATRAKSSVLMIPSQDIRESFVQDIVFARNIAGELSNCYRDVIKDHKNHKLRTSVERLANKLLKYRKDQGSSSCIEIPYDKKTLASLLGMTPENLSRAFGTLKAYGVDVEGAQVNLSDIKSLTTLAKPNPLIDDRLV